jgi:hypothetical protein
MLGVLFTALLCLGAAGMGLFLLRRLLNDLDPALRFGVGSLLGLGLLGTLTLPIILLPGGTGWGVYVVSLIALAGLGLLWKERPSLSAPKGLELLFVLAAVLVFGCSLVAVLAPSDSFDWDTLAYHLAVPKLWIEAGQMHYISFIHHSNFPGDIDDLYVWGLNWGGQSGAKAVSWMFGIFGCFALFGFARQRYGTSAGWWAVLAYVGIPLVGWECGTAYIDVGNGLFVGLGILFAAAYISEQHKKAYLWLSAISLGFAAGSKYTGLQTVLAVGLVELVFAALARKREPGQERSGSLAAPILAGLIAVAVCSPWYVKNVINTGNPVYPFFYSVFKGKNWDAFSDKIYQHQQQTFGAGRPFAQPNQDYPTQPLEPARIGASVLGLAYQPGRYTDPQPTQGGGFPFQSLGAIPLAALLLWMLSGRVRKFEGVIAAAILISFCMWFVLSEQSRYIVGLFFPACVLAGGAVATLRFGPLLAGASIVQLLASVVVYTRYPDPESKFSEKLKVVLGSSAPDEYQHRFISFYDAAQELNKVVGQGRVALFDEVFGYLLDVPYFWANPGHSTQIGYEHLQTADQFVQSLQGLGITYVYINLGETFGESKEPTLQWLQAAGLEQPKIVYPNRAALMSDPQSSYKVLLAEAIAQGKLTPYGSYHSGLIFTVQPSDSAVAK